MTIVNDQTKGFTTACVSALFLSMTGICIRYLTTVERMEPLVLAFWRNFFLTIILFLVLECLFPMLVEISRSDLAKMAVFGLLLALFNFLWTTSVAINGAAVATFLVYSSVPFTAIFGKILLGETLNLSKIIAVSLALFGCLLVSGTFGVTTGISLNGIFCGLGAGLCFAFYTIMGRSSRSNGLNSWTIMLYSFGFAAFFLLAAKCLMTMRADGGASVLPSLFSLGTSVSGWGVLLLLAAGPTLIGFGLFNVSLGYLPSHSVNLITTAEPPLTAIFAFFIFGETLSLDQLVGAGFILAAFILLKAAGRKRFSGEREEPAHRGTAIASQTASRGMATIK